jgi:hypothetical protein
MDNGVLSGCTEPLQGDPTTRPAARASTVRAYAPK